MAMAAKKVETLSGNSINNLPDEVLGQILSYLPTRLAASTTLISKRWRNLLPLVHNFEFDGWEAINPNRYKAFLGFWEKTIALLATCNSPINKLSLKLANCEDDEPLVNHLIHNSLQRGVVELDLSSSWQCLEPEFFFCSTLVKLTLSDGFYLQVTHPPAGVLFPTLKTLSLLRVSYGAVFTGADLYYCLLSSPVLEEINICEDDIDPFTTTGWMHRVWGSSIQRFSLIHYSSDLEDYSCFSIQTPNLVYLDCSSYVAEDYEVQLDSLVEARLDLRLWKYNNDYIPEVDQLDSINEVAWGDATKLIAAIRNVVTLHLSADSLEVFHFCCKSMPEFNNLVKLSFESHKERSWQALPLLLKKSPNLETLVIKGLVHKITDQCGDVCACVHEKKKKKKKKKKNCCLLSCGVKELKVNGYGGSSREVKQMRHFMEKLRCLELVKVKVLVDEQNKYLPLASDLMNLLPAASSKCKIQFI